MLQWIVCSRILVTSEEGLLKLKEALKQVWGNNEAYRLDRAAVHKERKQTLLDKKSEFLGGLAANPDLADDLKEEITKINAEITNIDIEMAKDSGIGEELAEFADFAVDYTEDLRKRWWELPGEKLAECKQLLFRSKIIVQPDGKVYTPELSYIYSLQMQNDDPKVVENRNMVELMLESWHLLEPEISRWSELLSVSYERYKLTGAMERPTHYQAVNAPG